MKPQKNEPQTLIDASVPQLVRHASPESSPADEFAARYHLPPLPEQGTKRTQQAALNSFLDTCSSFSSVRQLEIIEYIKK
jgi:hypothetical protein